MGIRALKLSELANLPDSDRSRRLSDFYAESSVPNGSLEFVREQIRGFEREHEMSSSAMLQSLASGHLKETASICRWLMFLEMQERLERTPTG